MPSASPFAASEHYEPKATFRLGAVDLPEYFSDAADEYEAATNAAALFDRSDRGLVLLSGAERSAWLHNLVTNDVNKLAPAAGLYAFALDNRGRIQFDCNILALPDELWIDIDHEHAALAMEHLERFHISEDVALRDASAEFARLACYGPESARVAESLGAPDPAEWTQLTQRALDSARVFRRDIGPLLGFEIILPVDEARPWWDRLIECGALPAGHRTLDALRIEAGIPWFSQDLNNSVLPGETGQTERAVSFQKGCYLGQEIVERMRAYASLARRLVRIRCDDGAELTTPCDLIRDGKSVGRITSLVAHPVKSNWIGLAYLSTRVPDLSGMRAGKPPRDIEIVP